MHLTDLRGRRVAVWGTGREGVAAVNTIAPVGPADLVTVQDRETFLARPWEGRLAEIAPCTPARKPWTCCCARTSWSGPR